VASAPVADTGFRGAWAHRQWRALAASYAISGTGDWLYTTALVVHLYSSTGSAGWVAVAPLARMVPYIAFGAFGGVLADRVDRRRLMVGLDAGRAVLMAVLAVAVSAEVPPGVVVVLAVLSSTMTVPYRPAIVAATPRVVSEGALAAANAAEAMIGQLTIFIGPAIAAVLLMATSPAVAIAVNGSTFLVSALLVAMVRDAGGGRAAEATDGSGDESSASDEPTLLASLRDGAMVLRRTPGLPALTVVMLATCLVFGAEGVLHVLVAEERLGGDPAFVGAMTAAIGVGGLVVGPLSSRMAGAAMGSWLIACTILQGAPLAVLAVVDSRAVALAVLAVEGVGVLAFEVLALTGCQRLAGDALGRVFGIQDALMAAAMLLGASLAPLAVTALGLEGALVVAALPLVALGVFGAGMLRRAGSLAADHGEALAPAVEVLGALALFEGASVGDLEVAAAAVRPVAVAAGDVVVVEGEPAEVLYVIRAGSFTASSAAGGVLSEMEAGGWFGELGLLRGIPRTATVTAATDGELWAIPGEAFLAAVGGGATLSDPVRRLVSERLRRTPHAAGTVLTA
jgi:predicted MFS family arabinose efflux permease